MLNVGILSALKPFWIEQKNKQVLDAINKLYKRRKTAFISTFVFPTLYIKLTNNELDT